MCCEICPSFMKCEEEGVLDDLCCRSCSEYDSCNGNNDDSSDDDESGDVIA